MMSEPIRSRTQAESVLFIKQSTWVKPEVATSYQSIQSALDSEDSFVPIFLNDYTPSNLRYFAIGLFQSGTYSLSYIPDSAATTLIC